MMTVPVIIMPSGIHGCGVFTNQQIRKGSVLWAFTPGLDHTMTKMAVEFAETRFSEWVRNRGYINPKKQGQWVVCCDEAQFLNFPLRGKDANTMMGGEQDGESLILAARDIEPGEEITVPPESDADYERKMKERGN